MMNDHYEWDKRLGRNNSLVLAALLVIAVLFYADIISLRLRAESRLKAAVNYLDQANSLPEERGPEKFVLYKKAIRLLIRHCQLNPASAKGYVEYGRVMVGLSEDDNLRSLFPEDYSAAKALDLAKFGFTEAISKEPANAIYHFKLGQVFLKLKDYNNAGEEFKRAGFLAPQDADINFYLARYFFQRQEQENFNRYLNKLISLYNGISHNLLGDLTPKIESFFKEINREDLIKK